MLRGDGERRRVAWEQELVMGMRRDEPEAFMEFFRAFRPLLLSEAHRLRVQEGLCDEMVDECLGDVAMRLRRHTTPVPRSLAPYLVKALRLHRLMVRRRDIRWADPSRSSDAHGFDASDTLAGSVSEAAVRDSRGPDLECLPGSSALERLATMVEEGLSAEEETLLAWVSHWVPQSTIAEWLGISHGAARNRVMRLRARLKEAALQHVLTFSPRERTELMDFFRRTFSTKQFGALAESVSAAATRDGGPNEAA